MDQRTSSFHLWSLLRNLLLYRKSTYFAIAEYLHLQIVYGKKIIALTKKQRQAIEEEVITGAPALNFY